MFYRWRGTLEKLSRKISKAKLRERLEVAKKRYSIAVSRLCFAANVFHSLHGGQKLTQSEMKKAMERVLKNRSEIRDDHIMFPISARKTKK